MTGKWQPPQNLWMDVLKEKNTKKLGRNKNSCPYPAIFKHPILAPG